jgi:hypothetical protein
MMDTAATSSKANNRGEAKKMEDEDVLAVLDAAIDPPGDIPAESCTEGQKQACRLCLNARDELSEDVGN